MKIYLLKRCVGEWEDYSERVVLCTNNKSKAEKTKEKLEQQEKGKELQYQKCSNCAMWNSLSKDEYDELKENVARKCNKFEEEFCDGEYYCKNQSAVFEDVSYKIEELKCEE